MPVAVGERAADFMVRQPKSEAVACEAMLSEPNKVCPKLDQVEGARDQDFGTRRIVRRGGALFHRHGERRAGHQ